jgi:SAM-dependent methyltransferase
MSRKKHWTNELFVDHSEFFLPYLEERLKLARKEALAIRRIFESRDVSKNGKVLDLCCGIGRHSVELAKIGYRVFGVDLAPVHIERAKGLAKKSKVSRRTKFVVGDMRNIAEVAKGEGKFDAAINMFTSFGFYGEREDLRLFENLAKLCRKGAVLVLETINRDWIMRNFVSTGISTIKDLEVHEFRKFNFETSFMENVWKFYRMDGEKRHHLATIELDHRIYSAHELIELLKKTGWRRADAYDGLELNPLSIDSLTNRLVIVAQR